MSVAEDIQEAVLIWKSLPIKTLYDLLPCESLGTYTSTIHRLYKRGKLNSSFVKKGNGAKLVYPSSKLIEESKLRGTLCINEDHMTHDALVASFCLMMLDFSNVESAEIEDYLIGNSKLASAKGMYPDAVIKSKIGESSYSVPIEVELHQKSTVRILEKYRSYDQFSNHRDVFFCFTSEKVARKYHEVFHETYKNNSRSKVDINIVFCWARVEDYISKNIDSFRALYESQEGKLSAFWVQ